MGEQRERRGQLERHRSAAAQSGPSQLRVAGSHLAAETGAIQPFADVHRGLGLVVAGVQEQLVDPVSVVLFRIRCPGPGAPEIADHEQTSPRRTAPSRC